MAVAGKGSQLGPWVEASSRRKGEAKGEASVCLQSGLVTADHTLTSSWAPGCI